jgi:hypothetical protein
MGKGIFFLNLKRWYPKKDHFVLDKESYLFDGKKKISLAKNP